MIRRACAFNRKIGLIIRNGREYWMIIEDQTFLRSYYPAPCPPPSPLSPSFFIFLCVELTDERRGERVGVSRIILPRESLALCKSFNTLCVMGMDLFLRLPESQAWDPGHVGKPCYTSFLLQNFISKTSFKDFAHLWDLYVVTPLGTGSIMN